MKKAILNVTLPIRLFALLAICLLIGFRDLAYSQPEYLQGLDNYIKKAMTDWKIPGLAIAVVKDDKVIFNRGYGIQDINKDEPVDASTLFAIASNTKAFTATALGFLVQTGKLDWDDPVLKYLPEFQLYDPTVTRKITIRDLLCHRSGLGKWEGDLTWWDSIYSREEVIRRIRYIELVSDFRTKYGYSNLMFLVAGEIIPQVTGLSWDEFIKKHFFEPLGMKRSNTSVKNLSKIENVAKPHTIVDDEIVTIPYVHVDNVAPAAAINSCINDLSQWLRLQLGNGTYNGKQLIDSTIIAETRIPHTLIHISTNAKKLNPSTHFFAYGLGWRLSDYQGRLVVNHTGGLDGMYSYVGFLPEENLGVVVLTNIDNHNLMRVLPYHIYDTFLGVDFQDWSDRYLKVYRDNYRKRQEKINKERKTKKSESKPSHSLSEYTGIYTSRVYGDAVINKKNGEMTISLLAHPQIIGNLKHWEYNTFLAKWNNPVWRESLVYFDLDNEGEIKQFRVSIRPDWIDIREYTFKKVND